METTKKTLTQAEKFNTSCRNVFTPLVPTRQATMKNLPQQQVEAVMAVTLEQVLSVYSGKPGSCCCGCSGTHRYPSAYREEGGLNRGYSVDDNEVNDAQVRKVLRLVQANAATAEWEAPSHMNVELNGREYIVYFRESEEKKAERRARKAVVTAEEQAASYLELAAR